MKYFIKTFGCQQNVADSERIASLYEARGMKQAKSFADTNIAIVNTCMIRHAPENRIRGLTQKLKEIKELKKSKGKTYKIIVTGCMAGMAHLDKTGKYLIKLRSQMPEVDEFMPIDEVGFDNPPLRNDFKHAWVPISNGCNNFCTFCVVPYTRGREISRPYNDIVKECRMLKKKKFQMITLLGQNVNSYGSDIDKKNMKPIYVKHLGKMRIPTLFPHLLESIAAMGFELIDFMSSNPWDFSDELIDVIHRNNNITRTIHLPVQSGDDMVLKRMNRWYTAKEYMALILKLKKKIPQVKITTDIIVGFCGETENEFKNTVNLVKEIKFEKAYVSIYSRRPFTVATKTMKDDVPYTEKKRRWEILENLIYRSKYT